MAGLAMANMGARAGGTSQQPQGGQRSEEPTPAERPDTIIQFSAVKGEAHTPGKGYRQLARLLKKNYQVQVNKETVSEEKLAQAQCVCFCGSRDRFEASEIDAIRRYLQDGGSVLFALGEGGDQGPWAATSEQSATQACNLNKVIEEVTGGAITVNNDCVVRTVYYKYFHPKEVHIGDGNGILNRELTKAAKKAEEADGAAERRALEAAHGKRSRRQKSDTLSFVYPHGGTVSVQRPAVPLLSSGYIAYPLNRPICAVLELPAKPAPPGSDAPQKRQLPGRLMVVGSLQMFEDKWIQEEDNTVLTEVLFWWLLHHPAVQLYQYDALQPDIADYHHLPDIGSLAERPRVCLESPEELSRDSTTMFDLSMFKFDTDLIPETVKAYEQLNVKHEPLTLIQPEFHTPLPPFYPATFPPIHREPPHPALDLFDLDEHFASERQRLAILTNKCTDEDLEYYITEAADIMGLTRRLAPDGGHISAKSVLEYIFKQIVQFKKLNHEELEKGKKSKPSTPVQGVEAQQTPLFIAGPGAEKVASPGLM
eukprot:TRINITY_DN16646_c0_g3_i1.p1 TRINITY_DN16646_c0_g3~~TRINITY_DN16646_c0_g3_i1.p1  ORF type:complete len:538 (+),score=199.32 TRINITY_DN16646_c0_g3_i1:117-1730(+)